MKRLLHRREQVFENRTCAELHFRCNLHAGREIEPHTILTEALGLETHQGAIFGGLLRVLVVVGVLLGGVLLAVARIGADIAHPAVDHAVFLELVRQNLDLDRLVDAHEALVFVLHPDFGLQLLVRRHQRHEHSARGDDGAFSVRPEILDDAGLGRLEFKQFALVLLLGPVLCKLLVLSQRIGPFFLQLLPVAGGDLRELFF